jgi:hypothetical protein
VRFEFMAHAKALTHDEVLLDAPAAAEHLRAQRQPGLHAGFCTFGGESWRLAATDLGEAGAWSQILRFIDQHR